jgi:RHS repeat-associated protein
LCFASKVFTFATQARGSKQYELTDHLGNIRTVVPDIKEPQTEPTQTTTNYLTDNDNFRLPTLTLNNYYPYGMLQAGRSRNAGGYRFGFNGMEQTKGVQGNGAGTFYDYKNRDYDPWIIRFKRTDALEAKYPFYSPYQFAGNKPINSIDLDGLEEYITIDGQYLGRPTNSTSEELRVVTSADAAKYSNNVDNMHNNSISYRTLPVYTYNYMEKKIEKSNMTMPYLLDLAHIAYSEEGGAKMTNYAHLLWNREIEFAKEAQSLDDKIIKYIHYPDEALKRDNTNTPILRGYSKYGIDYVLFSVHMPNNAEALEKFKQTLRETGVQIDGGEKNGFYYNFFLLKDNIPSLMENIPPVKKAFKENIGARLNLTTDPKPKYEGWRSDGPKNEVNQNSETMPKTNNNP